MLRPLTFSIFLPAVVIIAMTGLHVLQSTYLEPRALPAEYRPNVRFLSLVFPCVRVYLIITLEVNIYALHTT